MKQREFASLLQHPLIQLEGFVLRKNLLLKPLVGSLLRGFCLESSGFDRRAFYVTCFVMPMCVPTTYIDFTFGDRVRKAAGGDRWKADDTDLAAELGAALRQAANVLSSINSLSDFIAYAESSHVRTERNLEGVGYALARAGQITRAIAVFDELLGKIDMRVDWQSELAGRINDLRRMLTDSPEKAHRHLVSSERETIRNLGLDEFRQS